MDCGIIRTRNRSNERTMPLADSLRELQELGCPVDLSVAMVEPRSCKLEIQQGEPQDSKIFDLEDGRFAFMFYVELYYHKSRPMHIADIEMRWPWQNAGYALHWLTLRTVTVKNRQNSESSSCQEYRFPGNHGWVFEADDVINHLLACRM